MRSIEHLFQVPVLKNVLLSLEHSLQIFYPDDPLTLQKECVKRFLFAGFWMMFLIGIQWKLKMRTLPEWCIAGSVSVWLVSQSMERGIEKKRLQLLRDLEEVLSQIRYYYYACGMVDEAIRLSMEETKGVACAHLKKIITVLEQGESDEIVEQYEEEVKDHFWVTLMTICMMALRFGDQKIEKRSLFVRNLDFLKQEVQLERLQREKMRTLFMGYQTIVLLPAFFIKLIEQWSMDNIPQMKDFYFAAKGQLVLLLFFFVTSLCFYMIAGIHHPHHSIGLGGVCSEYLSEKKQVQKLWFQSRRLCGLRDWLETQLVRYSIEINALVFFLHASLSGIFVMVMVSMSFWSYWGFRALEAGLLLGSLAFLVPVFLLFLQSRETAYHMQEEVLRFQTIIYVLMYMEQVCVRDIVIWLERFSKVFHSELEICMNHYEAGESRSLHHLLETVTFRPFQRLIRQLLISDRIGLENAFENLNSDQEFQLSERKQRMELLLQRKCLICNLLAYGPMAVLILFYLIIPFVGYGLQTLSGLLH